MADRNAKPVDKPVNAGAGTDGSTDADGEHIGGFPVEPIAGGSSSNRDTGKRKPGRPKGSGNGSAGRTAASGTRSAKEEKKPVSLSSLSGIISTLHELAAYGTGSDKWQLDDDECERLAKALLELQKYYPSIDLPGVVLAWVNLATACTSVYGPRIGSALLDAKGKKTAPGPVVMRNAAGLN